MKTQTLLQFAKSLTEGMNKSPARKRCLLSTYNKLRKYKGDKDFSDVGKAFFENWCSQFKSYSQSSLSRDISNIRYFVNEAVEEGLTATTKHKTTKFKMPREEAQPIYLTEQEILSLRNLDLSKDKSKANVRNLFVIASLLGQRFGDVVRLKESDLKGDVVTIMQKKSKTVISVPVHYLIHEIIEQHGMPKPVSLTYFNKTLPLVGSDAGINELITVNKTVNGKMVTTTVPKYSLMKSHTARRSCLTNLIKAGIPTERVKLLSGHSPNSQSFNKYVRLSALENANDLKSHQFFNKH